MKESTTSLEPEIIDSCPVKELYTCDLEENGQYLAVNAPIDKRLGLQSFLIDMCRTLKSSKTYSFNEDSDVEVKLIGLLNAPSIELAQSIASNLTVAEENQRVNFEIKEGSLIIARIHNADWNCFLLVKVDFENYFKKGTYNKEAGLPEEKGILKFCLVNVNEDGSLDDVIYVADKNKVIAKFWSEKFLEAKELKNDSVNTFTAFKSIKDTIKNELKDSKPNAYELQNCAISYFLTHDKFDYSEFIDEVIKPYKSTNEDKLDLKNLEEKLNKIKESKSNGFDGCFDIKLPMIKSSLKRVYKLDGDIELKVNGSSSGSIFRAKLKGSDYILVKTKKGLENFDVWDITNNG
ncbi:nucleoid-associated protein [Vibrio splendidus]